MPEDVNSNTVQQKAQYTLVVRSPVRLGLYNAVPALRAQENVVTFPEFEDSKYNADWENYKDDRRCYVKLAFPPDFNIDPGEISFKALATDPDDGGKYFSNRLLAYDDPFNPDESN